MSVNLNEDQFLTVEEAFDKALENLKDQNEQERGKIYVWRQRFKEGNLSHKKIGIILGAAGMVKVVEERWMVIYPSENKVTKKTKEPKQPKPKKEKESKAKKQNKPQPKPKRKKIIYDEPFKD